MVEGHIELTHLPLATSSPPVGSTAARGSDVSSTLKKSNHLTHRRGTYIHPPSNPNPGTKQWSALLRSAGRNALGVCAAERCLYLLTYLLTYLLGRNALGYGLQRVREVVYGCSWYCASSPPPRKAPSTPSSHVAGARGSAASACTHMSHVTTKSCSWVVQVQLAKRRVRSRACQVDAEVVRARAAVRGPHAAKKRLGEGT